MKQEYLLSLNRDHQGCTWKKIPSNGDHTSGIDTNYRKAGIAVVRTSCLLLLLLSCFLFNPLKTQAQQLKLGNNPSQINKAALLELESGNQGLRLTRVDTGDVNAVISSLTDAAQKAATNGMIVFQTSDSSLYYRTGGLWKKIMIVDSLGVQSINGDKTRNQTLSLTNAPSSTLGFQAPVNGAQVLNIPLASSTDTGLVTTEEQDFSGTKRLLNSPIIKPLTPGSVVFIGNDTALSENNGKLFWDNTNGELGIGTNTPQKTLDVNGGFKLGTIGTPLNNLYSYTISNPNIVINYGLLSGLLHVLSNGQLYSFPLAVPNIKLGDHVIINPTKPLPEGLIISWVIVSSPGYITIGITYVGGDLGSLILSGSISYTDPISVLVIQ